MEGILGANTNTQHERRLRIVRATEKDDEWGKAHEDEEAEKGEGEEEEEGRDGSGVDEVRRVVVGVPPCTWFRSLGGCVHALLLLHGL